MIIKDLYSKINKLSNKVLLISFFLINTSCKVDSFLKERIRINENKEKNQTNPLVSFNKDGTYVVSWINRNRNILSNYSIFARKYDRTGTPIGSEFKITDYNDYPIALSTAIGEDGKFIIVQSDNKQETGLYAKIYSPDGNPIGTEFKVNTSFISPQESSISIGRDGKFVITWQGINKEKNGEEIYAQRYNSRGEPVGIEIKVNSINQDEHHPSITIGENDKFVITWQRYYRENNYSMIIAKDFNWNGEQTGNEIEVMRYIPSPNYPKALVDRNGKFFIFFQTYNYENEDAQVDICTQRYNSDGTKIGLMFKINTFMEGDQESPVVSANKEGQFVVTWQSTDKSQKENIFYGQKYDQEGRPLASEFRLDINKAGNPYSPSVAMDKDDSFIIAWVNSYKENSKIYIKRFDNNKSL